MATKRIDAAQLAKRTLRRLKVCVALLFAGGFVLAVAAYSWLFSWMCAFGLATFVLNLLAWGGLASITCLAVLGVIHFADEERLYPLMKANLLAAFPEQRKDLDAWLATELYAPDGEATWKLINRRLRERLDPNRSVALRRKPVRPLLFLLPGLLLVLAATSPGPSRQALQAYGRRLVLGHDSRPLQVVSINPSTNWVVRGEPLQLDLLFDRTVEGAVEVVGTKGDWRSTMERAAPKAYSLVIPTDRDELRFNVQAEDLKTDELVFSVLPARPVRLQMMSLITATGQVRDVVLNDGFPARAKTGDVARFSVTVSPGPWVTFGLGSRKHGEVPLTRIGRGHAYGGDVVLAESDAFFFFWQLPGRDIQRGPDLSVVCAPNQPPVTKILSPRNETAYDALPKTIDISYEARDDGGIDFAWLIVTDYFDLNTRIDLETGPRTADISGSVTVAMADLASRQGRILGFCLVARDSSKKHLIGTSKPVNLILPGGALNPENKERMRIFWEQALGRETDQGSEDAIKKLDRAAGNDEKPGNTTSGAGGKGGEASGSDGKETADGSDAGKAGGEKNGGATETADAGKDGEKTGAEKADGDKADGQKGGGCAACAKKSDKPDASCASCQGRQGAGKGEQAGDSSQGGSGKSGNGTGDPGKTGQTAASGGDGQGRSQEGGKPSDGTSRNGGQTTAGSANTGGAPGNPLLENLPDGPEGQDAAGGRGGEDKNPEDAFSSKNGRIATGDGRKGKVFEGDVDLGKQTDPADTVESSNAQSSAPGDTGGGRMKPLPGSLASERLNTAGKATVLDTDDLAKTYEHVLKKLTPEERRRLLEYYRYLKDVEKAPR